MTENLNLRNEYKNRINRALDYIEKNFEKQFSLDELAGISNFSKFHFHRIFQAIIGETPFQFISRVRIEKAAMLIVINKSDSISDIAFRCGYTDISIFSRNFKNYFKISPSQYRKEKDQNSNISQKESKIGQEQDSSQMYFCTESQTIKWRTFMKLNKSIEVKELPEMTVAYIRHIGPYAGDSNLFENLWNKLFAWAGPRGLLANPDLQSLCVYHDDPNVTEEAKLRTSICITVNDDVKVDGEFGKMTLEGGKYAVARFELTAKDFAEAWGWVYGEWLPSSGYQPDDKPCFEAYPEEPKDGKFVVDICVPVKAL